MMKFETELAHRKLREIFAEVKKKYVDDHQEIVISMLKISGLIFSNSVIAGTKATESPVAFVSDVVGAIKQDILKEISD